MLAVDRDAGQCGEPRHQLEVALQRAARLAEMQRDRAEHATVGGTYRRGPARADAGGERWCAQVFPQRVARDLRDDDLSLQEDRRGTGAVARSDFHLLDGLPEVVRQALSGGVAQRIGGRIEQADGAERIRRDSLGRLRDGLQCLREPDVAGDSFEYPALADGEQLAALALGDVGDTAADQSTPGGGQAYQADLAGNVVTLRIPVHPLEAGRFPLEGAIEVAAGDAERRGSVRLLGRTDPVRADRKQFIARHLEETHGVVVALDEVAEVHVEHDDRLGSVLDQRAVAGLAVADCRLGELAIRGVAQADDEDVAAVELDLAHADFRVEQRAVHAAAACLARRKVDLRVLERLGEFGQRLGQARATGQ